ncbi:MAG: 2OG-Fe(II) oxygenase [Planctomycetota bacterium]|nr:2OG-Fe(II) oxygenase [Planctomycetota bacterium]
MAEWIQEELTKAIEKIDRPGAFCVQGTVPLVLPGLQISGMGSVGLPLTAAEAGRLKKHCVQAPYGKGEETLVDTKVRRVWKLSPDRFELTNPGWNDTLAAISAAVATGLGLDPKSLSDHLYDLLLYEPGGFFLPHRDGEKLDGMVATLVITLPGAFQGGELVVRHDGEETQVDFKEAREKKLRLHYAAFYADCEHEVRPLKSGHRLSFIYNLTLKSKIKAKAIAAPSVSSHEQTIRDIITKWVVAGDSKKLVVALDHQYTQTGLAWDMLKGADALKARVLRAEEKSGCEVALAQLTLWESGSSEDGYDEYESRRRYGRRRYYDDDDDDDDDEDDEDDYEDDEPVRDKNGAIQSTHSMGELYDWSLTAEHWIDGNGDKMSLRKTKVLEEEVVSPIPLKRVISEEEYEGYTGNEGMTLERWYRRAAVVLWPSQNQFELLCDSGGAFAVLAFQKLVNSWKRSAKKNAPALLEQCRKLAEMIVARWKPPEPAWHNSSEEPADASGFLDAVATLDQPDLISEVLEKVVAEDAAIEPGAAFLAACRRHGWDVFETSLSAVLKNTSLETAGRNAKLLEMMGVEAKKSPALASLASRLFETAVTAVEAMDLREDDPSWRRDTEDRVALLAQLTRAFLLCEQALPLARLLTHVKAHQNLYGLRDVHVPALTALWSSLPPKFKARCELLGEWVEWCRSEYEALTASAPQEPTTWVRPASLSCACEHCRKFGEFLRAPNQQEFRLKAAAAQRNHITSTILTDNCDVDHRTETRGTPHTLVCKKNNASHLRAVQQYEKDLLDFETIVELEGWLSG